MKKILNLTVHPATPDQVAAGVVDITDPEWAHTLRENLNFPGCPDPEDVWAAAMILTSLAVGATWDEGPECRQVMIGGALWLMGPLEICLRRVGLTPVYAFSVRESVETPQPDGTVRKTNVFRHAGFVEGAL